MPRAAEAHAWWAEVEDVRERIERRRARERRLTERRAAGGQPTHLHVTTVPAVRGVREIRPGRRLMLVETAAPPEHVARGRARRRPRASHRVGPRPDRIAAWAVALGFLLVLVAIVSAH